MKNMWMRSIRQKGQQFLNIRGSIIFPWQFSISHEKFCKKNIFHIIFSKNKNSASVSNIKRKRLPKIIHSVVTSITLICPSIVFSFFIFVQKLFIFFAVTHIHGCRTGNSIEFLTSVIPNKMRLQQKKISGKTFYFLHTKFVFVGKSFGWYWQLWLLLLEVQWQQLQAALVYQPITNYRFHFKRVHNNIWEKVSK